MSVYREIVTAECEKLGIALPQAALAQLEAYAAYLIEYNEKVNLTAITEPAEIAHKHFVDSLLFFKAAAPAPGARVIDVGTGAGFPGVVLKIARPDLQLTLLDSLNKRLVFLQQLLERLGLSAELVHSRAEDGAKPPLRESFDFATARAVQLLGGGAPQVVTLQTAALGSRGIVVIPKTAPTPAKYPRPAAKIAKQPL